MTSTSNQLRSSQFDLFLRSVAVTTTGFGAIELLVGLLLDLLVVSLVGCSVLAFTLCLVGIRRVLRTGRIELAGSLAVLAFLGLPVIFVTLMPALLPIGLAFVLAACSMPMLFRSRRLFSLAAASAIVVSLLLAAISLMPPRLPQPDLWVIATINLSSLPASTALLSLFFYFIWQSFSASLAMAEQANGELSSLQATLAEQVVERTAALEAALADVRARSDAQAALFAENRQQRDTIRSLSVPVLPIGAGTLVMPLVGALDAERLDTLLRRALDAIAAQSTRRLVLDITGVPVIDEQVAEGLMRVPQAARLLGAEVVLVGISPEVAQTVVGLGLDFAGVRTASTLQDVLGDSIRVVSTNLRTPT